MKGLIDRWQQLDRFEKLSCCLAIGAFVLVVLTVGDFGISWDEPVQSNYGRHVINFYQSFFKDLRATTDGNLYLYGGLFEGTVEILYKWMGWLPRWDFRHFLNALVGLAGVYGTYKVADHLQGSRAAFFAALCLLFYPVYYGHMFFNPKDIPFATGYIWSIYFLIKFIDTNPAQYRSIALPLGLAIGASLGIRVGGFVLIAYLALASFLVFVKSFLDYRGQAAPHFRGLLKFCLIVILISYVTMLVAWPWALTSPFAHPIEAFSEAQNFKWNGNVLFSGKQILSSKLPLSYVPHMLFIQLPEYFIAALVAFVTTLTVQLRKQRYPKKISLFIVSFSAMFPFIYVMIKDAVLYDNLRHLLFAITSLAVLAGIGIDSALRSTKELRLKKLVLGVFCLGWTTSIGQMIYLHPFEYAYYNSFVTLSKKGLHNQYETDYWGQGLRETFRIFANRIEQSGAKGKVKVYAASPNENIILEAKHHDRIDFVPTVEEADYIFALTRGDSHKQFPGVPFLENGRYGTVFNVVLAK